MSYIEFLRLLPYLMQLLELIPEGAELLKRIKAGEVITPEEVQRSMDKVRASIAKWDATEAG